MDQAENSIGPTADSLSADLDERREMPRCAVDVPVTLVVLSQGSMMIGRMTELSLGGCRVLLPKVPLRDAKAAVECTFKIRCSGFRLGGIVDWVQDNLVRVQFTTMSSRTRDDLVEVLCDVELENNARALASAQPAAKLSAAKTLVSAAPPQPNVTAAEKASSPAPLAPPVAAPPMPAAQNHPPAHPNRGRDRRIAHRCGVDTSAIIDLVKVGSKLQGHILDLSVGGCRIRTLEKFPVGIYTRIETEFKLHGLPFRLGGVIQAIHNRDTVGIRFLDMSARKKDQVAELVAELDEVDKSPGAENKEQGTGNRE